MADTPVLPSVTTHQALLAAGVDATTASFAASQIDTAAKSRAGVGMNELEIAEFDCKTERKWGADFSANRAAVDRAFNRAGVHAQALKTSVMASGQDVALFVFETLKNAERNRT